MQDENSGEMLCIECNPRLHSAIVLMDTRRESAASAIYKAMENETISENEVATPDPNQKDIYWLYNEVSKLSHGESKYIYR